MKTRLLKLREFLADLKHAVVANDAESLLMDLRDQMATIEEKIEFWNEERRIVEARLRQVQSRQVSGEQA